jgi:hypothetical protein
VLLRTIVVAVACALLAAPAAAPHNGIPTSWWLTEQKAFASLREAIRPRYQPAAFKTYTGRCEGAAPRTTRDGRSVYKHFNCRGRMEVNNIGYTFLYTLHVTGPRGRVQVGGAL